MKPSTKVAITLALAAAAVAVRPDPAHAQSDFRRTHVCGTPQVRHSFNAEPWFAGTPRIVYLNRYGGTYQITGNTTNSSTNTAATFVSANGGSRTAVIAPMASGFNWTTIAQCVRNFYAPYNVYVVETEPSSGQYVEAVVGGDGTELGYGRNELFGIAAADNFCGVTPRGIAFSFSETHRGVPQADQELCATIAHEVGHLLALEHETLATDLMSYVLVSETTSKSFVDQNSSCGVYPNQPTSCSCGGSTTNSAARLRQFVGTHSTETTPPTVALVNPGNGATVRPSFTIEATATDNDAIAEVSFEVDGTVVGSDTVPDGTTYTAEVTGLAEGQHSVLARAIDPAGNSTTATATVTVTYDCGGCDPGFSCVQGECYVATGEPCRTDIPCAGGQCVQQADGDQFCTQTCDVSNDTCPGGFECVQAGDNGVCNFSAGCCSAGGRDQAVGSVLLMLAVGLVMRRRRRRA